MKLVFKDLPCYQNLTEEEKAHPLYSPTWAFNLDRLPTVNLKNEFAAFIFDRADSLSYLSLRCEQGLFHGFADFLSECFPTMESILDVPRGEIEKKLRFYLLKNKKPLYVEKTNSGDNKTYQQKNKLFGYLNCAYDYFSPKKTAGFSKRNDVWRFEDMPFSLRASPTQSLCSINFEKIRQAQIKDEVKEGILYTLKRKSASTAAGMLYSMNYLSEYLDKNFNEVTSLSQFTREHLEDYLSYLYLECDRRKDYRTELNQIKSLFLVIGKLYSYDNLRGIFLKTDFEAHKQPIYKCYSDSEIHRLHDAYRYLDPQIARLLLIHELLGSRISETLTLKQSDVVFSDSPTITITQEKTGNTVKKRLSKELCDLLTASIDCTNKAHGPCTYIFVYDKDPTKPMKYRYVYYHLNSLIHKHDLRDDNGNLFRVGTHLFRHTYGKRLCDLLNDDATIAALLGHASISSVAYYRRMSPKKLAETAQPVIDQRNDKIKQFKKGWMS